MADVVLAPSESDARAAEAVVRHHAQLSGSLTTLTESVVAAATRGDRPAAYAARQELAGWCTAELVPHAAAEEDTLYAAARATDEGRLLVDGMLAEHEAIVALVRELDDAVDPVRAAGSATALRALFEVHLAKENELVLPLLQRTPGASVADLLDGMHQLTGGATQQGEEPAGGCGSGHGCACGEADPPGLPELDVRTIPHAVRHAAVHGALEAVPPGGGLVLVAPHDPVRLLAELEERTPGRFSVGYAERGPETWRLRLVRRHG
jgi:uncharacterized protein (DUF2249 family)/iron-sulfur cluster repair protein YtfE (RIC family)